MSRHVDLSLTSGFSLIAGKSSNTRSPGILFRCTNVQTAKVNKLARLSTIDQNDAVACMLHTTACLVGTLHRALRKAFELGRPTNIRPNVYFISKYNRLAIRNDPNTRK
eukprot:scpid41380/ scgid14515/ 